jgi:signal transduction histidine kinase
VRFTSDVNHELRAPVAAMFSTLSVARRHQDDPKAAARAIDELEGRVRDLYKLVEDLLEISRAEAGVAQLQVEAVDLVGLTAALLERLRKSDVPLEVAEGVPATIRADKRRVGQMLQNLLDNADHYAGGATRVEISSRKHTVRIAVEDHGPGVAAHQRSFIFERFARGDAAIDRAAGGTGLGLALVAEHVALHGGRVDLEDRPGGGARFVIELPVDQPEVPPESHPLELRT